MTTRIVRVEQELAGTKSNADLLAELEAVDAESAQVWVPPLERVAYLEFRQLIADVRDHVRDRPEPPEA